MRCRSLPLLLLGSALLAICGADEARAQLFGTSVDTQPNIFGGQNIYRGGRFIGRTQPNSFGGFDFISPGGMTLFSTRATSFGGQTFYQGGRYVGFSIPNTFAGSNYISPSGMTQFSTRANSLGGVDLTVGGRTIGFSRPNSLGGQSFNFYQPPKPRRSLFGGSPLLLW